MSGPVQLLVLGYDEPDFSGDVLAEARRLEQQGIARVVDVLVVSRLAAGDLRVIQPEGLPDGSLAHRLLDAREGEAATAAAGETWSLADAVPAGGVAVVVLLEHLWAAGLVEAIGRSGGRPLDEVWLGAEDRALLSQALAERE